MQGQYERVDQLYVFKISFVIFLSSYS